MPCGITICYDRRSLRSSQRHLHHNIFIDPSINPFLHTCILTTSTRTDLDILIFPHLQRRLLDLQSSVPPHLFACIAPSHRELRARLAANPSSVLARCQHDSGVAFRTLYTFIHRPHNEGVTPASPSVPYIHSFTIDATTAWLRHHIPSARGVQRP